MTRDPISTMLKRGLRGLCPRCGRSPLFVRWHHLQERCGACGCEFKRREGDCWGFMYLSLAFFIGLILIWMIFFPPANSSLGYLAMAVAVPLLLVVTLPYRKGLAMALDCIVDPGRDRHSHPAAAGARQKSGAGGEVADSDRPGRASAGLESSHRS